MYAAARYGLAGKRQVTDQHMKTADDFAGFIDVSRFSVTDFEQALEFTPGGYAFFQPGP